MRLVISGRPPLGALSFVFRRGLCSTLGSCQQTSVSAWSASSPCAASGRRGGLSAPQ